jgi:hypothetical protein
VAERTQAHPHIHLVLCGAERRPLPERRPPVRQRDQLPLQPEAWLNAL